MGRSKTPPKASSPPKAPTPATQDAASPAPLQPPSTERDPSDAPSVSQRLKGYEGWFSLAITVAAVVAAAASIYQWKAIGIANDIALESRRAKLGAEVRILGYAPYGFSARTPPPGGRTIAADVPLGVDLVLTNRGQQPARAVTVVDACTVFLAKEPDRIPCSKWQSPPPMTVEPGTTHTELISRVVPGEHLEDVWDGKLTPFVFVVVRYDDGNGKYWRKETCLRVGTQLGATLRQGNTPQPCRLHNREIVDPVQAP